jgi:hypothetical protein
MTFFSPEKLKRRQIEIDSSTASCDSPEVKKRLARIQDNYRQLNEILADLESKIESDERLKAIDDAEIDFESAYGIKKKRKWRPAKTKASRKTKAKRVSAAAANPKKPR